MEKTGIKNSSVSSKAKIAQVVVGLSVPGPFDYFIPESLRAAVIPGQRVRVSFNRRERLGVIVALEQQSAVKGLKPLTDILDPDPVLDEQALELTRQMSEYYGCSWGEAVYTYLPVYLRRLVKIKEKAENVHPLPVRPSSSGQHILIHDETFQQGWQYMQRMIEQVLEKKQSVLFLLPDSHRLEWAAQNLREHLSPAPVTVLDRALTPKKEFLLWTSLKQGGHRIVLGTRSAVFAPLAGVGLIIIHDEEHSAYKQEQTPHYHVRKIAELRSQIEGCSVAFMSPTPTVETWYQAQQLPWQKKYYPVSKGHMIQRVDMSNYNPRRSSIISFPLQHEIQKVLEKKGQVLLLLNRRGFSSVTRCHRCEEVLKCPRCNIRLMFMYSTNRLVCCYCNHTGPLPKRCPHCQGAYLKSSGTGIEKIESEIARLFAPGRICRYDRDSEEYDKGADIYVVTQAFLRWRQSFLVNLTAVLNFDEELSRFDWRSSFQAFSLLKSLQLMATEKCLVQTRLMDHYVLKSFPKGQGLGFYEEEIKYRQELLLPPFGHVVEVVARSLIEEAALQQITSLHRFLEKNADEIEVSDPQPDRRPKLRDQYRFVIHLKGTHVPSMLALIQRSVKKLKAKRNVILTVNVDA